MPLVTILAGIKIATPLVGLVFNTCALIIIMLGKKHINIKESLSLVIASLIRLPIGLLLLTKVPEGPVNVALGVLLTSFGLCKLRKPPLPYLRKDQKIVYVFGFLSGLLAGAYTTSAPPMIIYGMLRRWTTDQFPTKIQSVLILSGIFAVIGHACVGLWTESVICLYFVSLPLIPITLLIGVYLKKVIPRQLCEQVMNIILVIMGLLLIF